MISYDDPRSERVKKLIKKLFDEASEVDKRTPNVYAGAMRDGFVKYFLLALYQSLDEDSMFVDHFPNSLQNLINEIGETEVIKKLES